MQEFGVEQQLYPYKREVDVYKHRGRIEEGGKWAVAWHAVRPSVFLSIQPPPPAPASQLLSR